MLVPICHFEVDITDNSGTLMVTVSEMLAKKMLGTTAEQIYETVAIKKQPLLVLYIKRQFADKVFSVQLQRQLLKIPGQKADTLAISEWTQKQLPGLTQLPMPVVSSERYKKQKTTPHTYKKALKVMETTTQRQSRLTSTMTCTTDLVVL